MSDSAKPLLRLVSSRQRDELSAECLAASTQRPLFRQRWTIVLVSLPALDERDFEDLLRAARPEFVYDLRLAPRFDIGTLRRQQVFQLFEQSHVTYVDTTTGLMNGSSREEAVTELLNSLRSIVRSTTPVVFLLSRNHDASLMSPSEVERALSMSGEELDVIHFPAA